MAQQATQDIESAIVLALANSLAEKCDSSLERALRASSPELLALLKDELLWSMWMNWGSIRANESPAKPSQHQLVLCPLRKPLVNRQVRPRRASFMLSQRRFKSL